MLIEETKSEVTEEKREREDCAICKVTGGPYGGLIENPDGVKACPFCMVTFRPGELHGKLITPDDDFEFVGACASFAEDVVQYHCNLQNRYRRAKYESENILPEALWNWALGQRPDAREQLWTVDVVARRLTYERILRTMEVAYAIADDWMTYPSWNSEWFHPGEAKRELYRHDVLRLWEFWLKAAGSRGKEQRRGQSYWYGYGARLVLK